MTAGLRAASITVSLRGANGSLVENRDWAASSIDGLAAAAPWRTFRWYRGQRVLARGEHLMAAIDAHEHTHLTGPAANEAARRPETFGERARFQGTVVLDNNRLRRLMAKHDPAVYPGQYVTCVHDHSKALCERARRGRTENLPNHGGCKPLACRNVALTPEKIAAWQREIDRITRRLASRPTLPPLLRHRLESRREEIAAFLHKNTAGEEST